MRLTHILLLGCLATAFAAQSAPNGRVVLCTDYGVDSIYVGILKGVIYDRFADARVDSLTNAIPPYDIESGARILAEGCLVYPAGTVFCCVVDPGVGTSRRGIALETEKGQYFVGPDNGLLALVTQRDGIRALHAIENAALWRDGALSSTFHGRDVFGPVAAALASGVPLTEVGPACRDMVKLELPEPIITRDEARGRVFRVDDYGNLITDIPGEALVRGLNLKRGEVLSVAVGAASFEAPFVRTYADVPVGSRLVLIQSMGYIELAVNKGNLAQDAGEGVHADIVIRRAQPEGQTQAGTAAADEVLLQFVRSGGIAGLMDRLTIAANGACELSRRRGRVSFTLTTQELRELCSLLDAANIESLPQPPERPGGADYISYDLTYGSIRRSFTTGAIPAVAAPALSALNNLIDTQAKAAATNP